MGPIIIEHATGLQLRVDVGLDSRGDRLVCGSGKSSGSRRMVGRKCQAMNGKLAMHLSPRCGARNRRGSSCQSPAMKNGRCRLHGGRATGAPKGNKNALKHGRYSAAAIAQRREVAKLLRAMKALVAEAHE